LKNFNSNDGDVGRAAILSPALHRRFGFPNRTPFNHHVIGVPWTVMG